MYPIIRNNVIYTALFADLAEFLMKHSLHEIVWVFENGKDKSMLKMTSDNIKKYLEEDRKNVKENKGGGCFFLRQELPDMEAEIKLIKPDREYHHNLILNSAFKNSNYTWLNWE